jgi:hypothetical protein
VAVGHFQHFRHLDQQLAVGPFQLVQRQLAVERFEEQQHQLGPEPLLARHPQPHRQPLRWRQPVAPDEPRVCRLVVWQLVVLRLEVALCFLLLCLFLKRSKTVFGISQM